MQILSRIFDDFLGAEGVRCFLLFDGHGCTGMSGEIFAINMMSDGHMVAVTDLFADENDDYELIIEKTVLLDLIAQWEVLIKQKPDAIIITKDGSNYQIRGEFDAKK